MEEVTAQLLYQTLHWLLLCLAKARMNLQVAALQGSGIKPLLTAEGEGT